MRKWAVIQFAGSNCDQDAVKALSQFKEIEVSLHWHEEPIKKGAYEVIVIPGGFSFGDYLRAGAIAKLSTAVQGLQDAARAGAHVIGICNGFQILLEGGFLPGFLQANQSLKFISKEVDLKVEAEAFPWLRKKDIGKTLRFPIAHGFGNYHLTGKGSLSPAISYLENPNGSEKSTAGVYQKEGKGSFFGLMPHPERASFDSLRRSDGKLFWKNALEALR